VPGQPEEIRADRVHPGDRPARPGRRDRVPGQGPPDRAAELGAQVLALAVPARAALVLGPSSGGLISPGFKAYIGVDSLNDAIPHMDSRLRLPGGTVLSHIVTVKTEVRDHAAVAAACRRLALPEPALGTAQLYSGQATGPLVRLP